MFNRKKYKNFAKQQLKHRWGIPIIIVAITLLVEFIFSIPGLIQLMNSSYFWDLVNSGNVTMDSLLELQATLNSSAGSYIMTIVQGMVSAIFEVAALNVYFKMTISPEPVHFSSFLEGLNNCGRAILAYLWRGLWTFLWVLLTVPIFCIPGIIKSISYSQIMFIIAENKEISIPKALKISMLITKGHKGELFVMYFTFLGWIILSSFTLGIGLLFLTPYMNLSLYNAYHGMLQEAIESGKLMPEDFTE